MDNPILEQFKKDFKLNENDLFIIQYIIEHSEDITSHSSHQLAKETYSSPTAVIRLVKKIGFENYNDFKLNIHHLLNKYKLSNMHIMSNEDLYTIKNKLAEIETGIINQTKEQLNSNVFNQVMTMISKNKYIDIIANDANAAISDYGSHILSSVNKIVNVYHNGNKQLWLSLNVTSDHTVILISKIGKTKHLFVIADTLKKRHIPFIIITTEKAYDLANKSPYVLYGINHAEFDSLKDMIFYISLKYLFDLIYTTLISNDLKQAKELDDLYAQIYFSENTDVTM